MASDRKLLSTNVLSFDNFWRWLQGHPNCILRAGTGEFASMTGEIRETLLTEVEGADHST